MSLDQFSEGTQQNRELSDWDSGHKRGQVNTALTSHREDNKETRSTAERPGAVRR